MSSVGIDRRTGQPLTGLAHLRQSLEVLFTTRIGSRVLKRVFGSDLPGLLGKNIVPSTFLKFATAVHVAIELWEPRFRLRQVTFPRDTNGPELVRAGRVGIALYGTYIPNGHLGDMTPATGTLETIEL